MLRSLRIKSGDAETILKTPRDILLPGITLASAANVLEAARRIPAGPARVFYARVMRELLFTTFGNVDRFWPTMAGQAFEGLSLAIDEVASEADINEDLFCHLVEIDDASSTSRKGPGIGEVQRLHQAPPATRQAILLTLRESISESGIERARRDWGQARSA